MANRNFSNGGKIMSMHAAPVLTTCNITIGASGAVASFRGATVASVTRVSAGKYTITLQQNTGYPVVLSAIGSMQSPSSGLSGISSIEIQNAPSASMSANAGSITVQCLAPAGTAADPASGSVVSIMILTNNSSVVSSI